MGGGWVGGRAGKRRSYLEPHDVLISEGSCKQQQRQALHLGHGSKALKPLHHVLPKCLQGACFSGQERAYQEPKMSTHQLNTNTTYAWLKPEGEDSTRDSVLAAVAVGWFLQPKSIWCVQYAMPLLYACILSCESTTLSASQQLAVLMSKAR